MSQPADSSDNRELPDESPTNRGKSCGEVVVFTYFMQADWGGPVKIGIASDPVRRHNIIQTGYPYKLLIRGVIQGNFEAELHERFCGCRMRGEWFSPCPMLIGGVDAVLRSHFNDEFRSRARFCYLLGRKGWKPNVFTIVKYTSPIEGRKYADRQGGVR